MYYVGVSKHKNTLQIEAVHNKDFLSCELYDYFGERDITKKELKARRYRILHQLQLERPKVYGGLRYAVVL